MTSCYQGPITTTVIALRAVEIISATSVEGLVRSGYLKTGIATATLASSYWAKHYDSVLGFVAVRAEMQEVLSSLHY